jgi:hypothetical protein
VGGTVSDGTVTWTIKSLNKSLLNIIADELSDCNDAVNNGLYSFDNNTANKPGHSGVLLSMKKDDRCGQLAFNLDGVGMNQYHMRTGYSLAVGHPQYTDWQRIDTIVAESLGTNGYRKYASGLIEQWGESGGAEDVPGVGTCMYNNLPISFTTAYAIIATPVNPSAQVLSDNYFSMIYLSDISTNSKAYFKKADKSGAFTVSGGFFWHAIGF